jgi:hypothetical protein
MDKSEAVPVWKPGLLTPYGIWDDKACSFIDIAIEIRLFRY